MKNSSVCNICCVVASGLFGSMLYVMILHNNRNKVNKLHSVMSPEQIAIYKTVVRERMTNYVYGMLLGLLLGFIYISTNPIKSSYGICTFTVIVLGTNYLYYSLAPKSTYMLNHLTNKEQIDAWVEVYKEMKYRCFLGFVLGIISLLLFGCAFRQ